MTPVEANAARIVRDPYRSVVLVLLGTTILATGAAVYGGRTIVNPVWIDIAVTLGVAAALLAGVASAQYARTQAEPIWLDITRMRSATALGGLLAVGYQLFAEFTPVLVTARAATIGASLSVVGAALAATTVHYLAEIDTTELPEALGLCRGARLIAWILLVAAAAIGLQWLGTTSSLRVLHVLVLAVNVAACYSLLTPAPRDKTVPPTFPLNLGVLSVFGSRANILGSFTDAAEQQLGIDLRSTWALTVVRTSVEPLIVALSVAGWLSTSLTVVGQQEAGLVERLGIPVNGEPLQPGLHLHWPWPVDRVIRIPVQRVQLLTVGHEGPARGGPEDVLWARQHAANEFTLLLGNGRDLITVDAAIQYRIKDARAWQYQTQNPAEALRAIAYRAVMRNTVNRTLADALSENVVTMAARMLTEVQEDADALGLGVNVVGFTVSGMHPPVPVAADYQAVVSAELGKVTAVANAQAVRNQTVPLAESTALVSENTAHADAAHALAVAAGEAWSFLTLQSQYRAEPREYMFRRRLETLENNLAGRHFTVIDSRFQRDGGELWINPNP